MNRKFYYILVAILATATVYKFTMNYYSSKSALHLSKIELKNNSVLYIKIDVVSFYYIDSLSIKQVDNDAVTVFNFNSKTKKASLDYFIEKDNLKDNNFVVRIYNGDNFEEYAQALSVN